MSINAALRLMAGCFILLSLALGYKIHIYWYIFTAGVGLNMLQSSFTKGCPAVLLFQAMGLKPEGADEVGITVHQGVHFVAGSLILIVLGLVIFANMTPNLLIILVVLGVSLIQSAFTNWCPMLMLMSMLGLKRTHIK